MPPAERPARRHDNRGAGVARRADDPRGLDGGIFIPPWQAGDTWDDLRAPQFRKGGVALEEAPAEVQPEAPEAAAYPEIAVAEDPVSAAHEAPEPGPAVIRGEPAPAEGARSVVLACLIGALIAALIIAGAFLLRPRAPEAPAEPAAASRAGENAG